MSLRINFSEAFDRVTERLQEKGAEVKPDLFWILRDIGSMENPSSLKQQMDNELLELSHEDETVAEIALTYGAEAIARRFLALGIWYGRQIREEEDVIRADRNRMLAAQRARADQRMLAMGQDTFEQLVNEAIASLQLKEPKLTQQELRNVAVYKVREKLAEEAP